MLLILSAFQNFGCVPDTLDGTLDLELTEKVHP
jgi:hypothetical protein